MTKTDLSLNKLMLLYLDGIPVELTSKLLPWKSRFNLSIYMHIYLHAHFIKKHSKTNIRQNRATNRNASIKEITNNLKQIIEPLKLRIEKTEWATYYEDSVEEEYLTQKKQTF